MSYSSDYVPGQGYTFTIWAVEVNKSLEDQGSSLRELANINEPGREKKLVSYLYDMWKTSISPERAAEDLLGSQPIDYTPASRITVGQARAAVRSYESKEDSNYTGSQKAREAMRKVREAVREREKKLRSSESKLLTPEDFE